MKNFSELKQEVRAYAKVFKVFKDAEELLQSLEAVEQAEHDLLQRVSALEMKEQQLIDRNTGIEQMFLDAEAKAAADVKAGEAEVNKLRERALADVETEKANVLLAQKDLAEVNAKIDAAKKLLQNADQAVASRNEELSALDKAKENAKKALGL